MCTRCLPSWFGVCGTVFEWFTSYLTNRVQSIKIGSTLSESCKLLFGVPQGSVLGPLLFSLYTSPLSSIIRRHKGVGFHFYADDTQLYVHLSHKNASSALDKLNQCLQDVSDWMSSSKLKLNPDKTEFIVFGSSHQRDKLSNFFQFKFWEIDQYQQSLSKIWVCDSILTYLSLSMLVVSAETVLCS